MARFSQLIGDSCNIARRDSAPIGARNYAVSVGLRGLLTGRYAPSSPFRRYTAGSQVAREALEAHIERTTHST
jgi:hypothetical protein